MVYFIIPKQQGEGCGLSLIFAFGLYIFFLSSIVWSSSKLSLIYFRFIYGKGFGCFIWHVMKKGSFEIFIWNSMEVIKGFWGLPSLLFIFILGVNTFNLINLWCVLQFAPSHSKLNILPPKFVKEQHLAPQLQNFYKIIKGIALFHTLILTWVWTWVEATLNW